MQSEVVSKPNLAKSEAEIVVIEIVRGLFAWKCGHNRMNGTLVSKYSSIYIYQ